MSAGVISCLVLTISCTTYVKETVYVYIGDTGIDSGAEADTALPGLDDSGSPTDGDTGVDVVDDTGSVDDTGTDGDTGDIPEEPEDLCAEPWGGVENDLATGWSLTGDVNVGNITGTAYVCDVRTTGASNWWWGETYGGCGGARDNQELGFSLEGNDKTFCVTTYATGGVDIVTSGGILVVEWYAG